MQVPFNFSSATYSKFACVPSSYMYRVFSHLCHNEVWWSENKILISDRVNLLAITEKLEHQWTSLKKKISSATLALNGTKGFMCKKYF